MARPYATEMSKLADTLAWAMTVDVSPLRKAIKTAGLSPLLAIGSGGSLTAAHALANMHQRYTGNLAAVATPLESIANPLAPDTSIWLLSAGGGNVDILAAFHAIVAREPRQLAIMCGKAVSPLADAAREHSYADLLIHEPPAGKDGFLATNSLVAFVTLLTRAYHGEFSESSPDLDAQLSILLAVLGDDRHWDEWHHRTEPLWSRKTILVLHGFAARIGAIDLESKFTEAAIGNLQIADYRNFAHGRHHWLAKRGDDSAVLAFVSEDDDPLAERTLGLIPNDIPQARLDINGSPPIALLLSLVTALRVAGWAGEARGIDPGRPGVPEFGRKLYHLPLPKNRRHPTRPVVNDLDAVAIERKSGLKLGQLARRGELPRWRNSLERFRTTLRETTFAGVVMDYDGTLVDARERFSPPGPDIASELLRILRTGARVGIATGRGSSVKRDLRAFVPPELWLLILVGYYNGSELGTLADEQIPDGTTGPDGELAAIAAALRGQSELADLADQTDRRCQITLEARRPTTENRLWDLAQQTVLLMKKPNLTITRSSHSIDIVAAGSSKLNVLNKLQANSQAHRHLLTIGDRGRWPGNDYELLSAPFSLGVDELNADPTTCWNLAPRGQRGIAATLGYLQSLRSFDGGLRFEGTAVAS
jgi:fructoselysine-6-P-deglycase FrlB-like protein/hydroxymethylpyrimidine pyrophosphatase-like HAD family hydrolase